MTIGLLYTKNDQFALDRSELLIGPMKLEKVRFVRFTNKDIDKNLLVKAQEYKDAKWNITEPLHLDRVLDFTLLNSKKTKNEKTLLEKTPSTQQIDLNRFELFTLLEKSTVFKNELIEFMELQSFDSLIDSINKWDKVVLKSFNEDSKEIYIIEKRSNKWIVLEPFGVKEIKDNKSMKEFIVNLKNKFFIQKFIASKTNEDQYISLNLVVQQRYDCAWSTPIIRGSISADSPFSSLKNGGELIGTPILHKENIYFDFKAFKTSASLLSLRIQRLGVCLARYIEEVMQKNYIALRISILLDQNLHPKISSIKLKTNAQNNPGRSMEFYKNITELAIGLIETSANEKVLQKPLLNENLVNPQKGLTIRNVIKEDEYHAIFNRVNFIDCNLGHGGRRFLEHINAMDTKNSNKKFLSLRIGHALNDYYNYKEKKTNIIAIDEYLGKGLVNWNEATHMRSLRTPLLKKQYNQIREFYTRQINLLWAEDVDISIQSIKNNHEKTIKETVEWFETLCQDQMIHNWGITLFNTKSVFALKVLNLLLSLTQKSKHFNYIGLRMIKLDLEVLNQMIETGKHIVIFSDKIEVDSLPVVYKNEVTILNKYNKSIMLNKG